MIPTNRIHSMELKVELALPWPGLGVLANPFNGIESSHDYVALQQNINYVVNPFNGIERIATKLLASRAMTSNPFNGIERAALAL